MSHDDDFGDLLHKNNDLLREIRDIELEKKRNLERAQIEESFRQTAIESERRLEEISRQVTAELEAKKQRDIASMPHRLPMMARKTRLEYLTPSVLTVGQAQQRAQEIAQELIYLQDVKGSLTPDLRGVFDQAFATIDGILKDLYPTLTPEDKRQMSLVPALNEAKANLKSILFLKSLDHLFFDSSKISFVTKLKSIPNEKKILYIVSACAFIMGILIFLIAPAADYFSKGKWPAPTSEHFGLFAFSTAIFSAVIYKILAKSTQAFDAGYKMANKSDVAKLHAELQKGYPHYKWPEYPDRKNDLFPVLESLKQKISSNGMLKLNNLDEAEVTKLISQCDSMLEKISKIPDRPVTISASEEVKKLKIQEAMEELHSLIGLASVKEELEKIKNLLTVNKLRKEQGLKTSPISLHLVFSGNPGTGKTTVARIVAKLYGELGLLKKGHLVEVDRAALVAGYIGQTAIKTQEKINEAIGGVLFIDEAYTLATDSENDFGKEAIDSLLKSMEDRREELAVIVAGYEDRMEKFINSNPGLESRFNRFVFFEDYNAQEMHEIFLKLCRDFEMELTPPAQEKILRITNHLEKTKGANFANAREIRKIFESTLERQANRLVGTKETKKLNLIEEEDFG